MDLKKVCIVLFFTISANVAQEDYKYLAEIRLSLREDRIPAIVNYLLNNSLEVYDVRTEDIIKLSKLDRYDYDAIVQVFNYFNISSAQVVTVNNLEKLLDTFNLTFGDFFRNVTAKLQQATEQTMQIVSDLEVPPNFWIGLSLNQKNTIFEALRKGVYDEEHVSAALKTAGKTRNEVYNAARDVVLEKVRELNSSTFMGILKDSGLNLRLAFLLYQALNITTSDIYNVEKFRDIFKSIVDDLNANASSGVFVGPNQLAVHDLIYQDLLHKVDGVTVKVEVDGLEVILRRNSSLGARIVELITVQPGSSYIEIVENYTAVENCTYVRIKNGSVVTEEVEIDGLTVKKGAGTEFILGSPLVCDGLLYGLAGKETENEIVFDVFYTEDSPRPEEIPEPDEAIEASRGQSISSLFGPTFILIAFVLCTR